VRRLGFPLDNWGTQYGPLGSQPEETLTAALQFLREQRREWDVIDLRWVAAEQCPEFVRAWRQAAMHFQQKLWSRTARIDLSQGWNSYWNSRTSKWRNNQRRSEKSLAKLGSIRIEHFRPECGATDSRDDLFELCEQVAETSWQGACSSGNTLSHPEVRSFLREAHRAAAKLGCVHLSLLYVGERPAAFTYNYVCGGVTLGLRMGYDLQFQAASPGAVLIRETIRECCDRGDHTFDLGESPAPYKRHFANLQFESFRFCHYSMASPLGQALRFKGWLANARALSPSSES
jgi:CelD/BcsL family acetyltransferase involved in cellulose biosynthesis